MNKAFLALILFTSSIAHSATGDTWINIHLASKHSTDTYHTIVNNRVKDIPFNESNIGIGIEHETSEHNSIIAGAYKNSVYKNSIYAGVDWHTSHNNSISVSLKYGVVSGYKDQYGYSLIPIITPAVNIIVQQAQVELTYIHGFGKHSSVLSITTGFRY